MFSIEVNLQVTYLVNFNKTQRSKRTKNYTIDWIFQNIPSLGYNLRFDTYDYEEYIVFQDLLDKIDVNNVTHTFDPQDKFEFKVKSVGFL